MSNLTNNFGSIVDSVYNLPLEEKVELLDLLENNIADARRKEIEQNFKQAKIAHREGKLGFSSDIIDLKKMLK